jgi:hypothetical protein
MPHAHWDVHVKPFIYLTEEPRGEAAVVLQQSSPFLQCTVSATPAAPTRDLSANIGLLLTAAAGIGAVPSAAGLLAPTNDMSEGIRTLEDKRKTEKRTPSHRLAQIEAELKQIAVEINNANAVYQQYLDALNSYREAFKADWNYSFTDDEHAAKAINHLKSNANAALVALLPDYVGYGRRLSNLRRELEDYAPSAPPDEQKEIDTDRGLLIQLQAQVLAAAEAQKHETARREAIRQLYDFLSKFDQKSVLTKQVLPMAYFSGKQVTETVSCKDAISNSQAFDNIVFTAYYEGLPHIEVSVGAIISLLGGRQVGTTTGAWTPAQAAACQAQAGSGSTTPCGPQIVLGNTTQSSYQFMPGVFVEWRAWNFRPSWVKNGSPVHKLGYLWSIGPVGGVAINPNNGTTEAEFFEGLSLGIQRFSIMVGFHDGRYQEYGGGYYAGEAFAPGTTVTPPTVRNWTVRPAFGIAYRIPIR